VRREPHNHKQPKLKRTQNKKKQTLQRWTCIHLSVARSSLQALTAHSHGKGQNDFGSEHVVAGVGILSSSSITRDGILRRLTIFLLVYDFVHFNISLYIVIRLSLFSFEDVFVLANKYEMINSFSTRINILM
jgi:hypothetical protein